MFLATALADPPCVAGLSALFTLAAERSIARAAREAGAALGAEERRQTLGGAAIGLWVAICSAIPAFLAPAWTLSYAEPLREVPLLVWYPAYGLGVMASGALGAFLSFLCLSRGNRRLARLIAGGFFFVWLACVAASLPRALVAGTWEQFAAGRAKNLAAQPRLLVSVVLTSALAAAAVAAAFVRRARSERTRPERGPSEGVPERPALDPGASSRGGPDGF